MPRNVRKEDEPKLVASLTVPASEAIQKLQSNIAFAGVGESLRVIGVTSAVQGEGKSTLIANMAYIYAQRGAKVCLVNLDLRRPSLHRFFQVKNTSTFSHDGSYIKGIRKEFFDKEQKANEYVGGDKYKMLIFYVYDKDAYIKHGEFRFYVNPAVDKCGFFLDHLIRRDGTLKLNVKHLKSKVLL